MIQDIYPHQFDNRFKAKTKIQARDGVIHFKGNGLLLQQKGESLAFPRQQDVDACPTEGIYLFELDGVSCFLLWDLPEQEAQSFAYYDIKFPHTITEREIDWASSVALQLKNWYAQHQFCGKCGAPMVHKADERAMMCTTCDYMAFPSISPAIIVAIISNDKILLARNTHFPEGFYSLIAGYTDVGETVEETIAREAQEEVGVTIKQVRYYKSQPWPFSGSMMIGFVAEAEANQTIQVDGVEISEADWFGRDELPNHPPDRSIAGEMIAKFKAGVL